MKNNRKSHTMRLVESQLRFWFWVPKFYTRLNVIMFAMKWILAWSVTFTVTALVLSEKANFLLSNEHVIWVVLGTLFISKLIAIAIHSFNDI